MGTTPVIRVKGMSRLQYVFKWDKESRHYAYEPKSQREADDIFKTQGRLYKRMFFSVLMDPEKKDREFEVEDTITLEELEKVLAEEEPEPKKKPSKPKAKKSKDLQAVEEVG